MAHSVPAVDSRLEAVVRAANPWWRGERVFGFPPLRRWAFEPVLQSVRAGLTPAVVLRGPRQVGKTTLMEQVIDRLLDDGVRPERILRLQFDELPELRRADSVLLELTRWFSEHVLGKSFNQAAQDGEQAFVFLDEVQNLRDWAPQLKYLVDMNPVRVLATCSSTLSFEEGRDSLAGRISTIEIS